jgi:hypothetical protein
MTKRKPKFLILGEGNDIVDGWIGPAAGQIGRLEKYRESGGRGDLKISWLKVLRGMDGIDARRVKSIRLENENDLPNLLDRISGINVNRAAWGGDSPGRDGTWIQVWIYPEDEFRITATLDRLLERLKSLYPFVEKA